ncbi:MAG: M56 family metallopeptidase [Bacteroidota bacterium]|nr:M56 family metallopeptidase [Bacteroidota bacterium]
MAEFGNSAFLQALGWATLNSFWQMALLWSCYLLAKQIFNLSSNQKYTIAVTSIFLGFSWFVYTFFLFFLQGSSLMLTLKLPFENHYQLLPVVLTSASIAYLALLVIPAFKMFKNWKYISFIKKNGLAKAPFTYRLFIQKISAQIGITKKVKIFASKIITSPVTVGFLKPVILIPVAAINNLSVQQLEAILLHELSHISRHDYLVNLLLTIIHVILYFNPFIKWFIKNIDIERENCCDELVLQFEYNQLSYASALLQLVKASQGTDVSLAMAATGKKQLLNRIEKIVGIAKKPTFNTMHFAGAFATIFLLFIINTLMVAEKSGITQLATNNISQPFSLFTSFDNDKKDENKNVYKQEHVEVFATVKEAAPQSDEIVWEPEVTSVPDYNEATPPNVFMQVALDDVDASLNKQQKEKVTTTIENTKSLLKSQWSEVEKQFIDGFTPQEKVAARQEYLREIENADWKLLEQKLKSGFEHIDWVHIDSTLNEALTIAQLDNIYQSYNHTLSELNKVKAALNNTCDPSVADISVQELRQAKELVQKKIEQIKLLRAQKVIKL